MRDSKKLRSSVAYMLTKDLLEIPEATKFADYLYAKYIAAAATHLSMYDVQTGCHPVRLEYWFHTSRFVPMPFSLYQSNLTNDERLRFQELSCMYDSACKKKSQIIEDFSTMNLRALRKAYPSVSQYL